MSGSRRITVNGQEFNSADGWVDGVEWEITDVNGLGDPANVFASEQLVGQDGAWATTGFRAPRAVGLQGVIRATDEVRAELAADRLRALIGLAEFPVTFHYLSGDRTVWVRRDGEVQIESREMPAEFRWSAVMKAVDPAIYAGDAAGSADLVLTTGLPMQSGGLVFAPPPDSGIVFPITFTGTSATGDLVVDLAAGGRLQLRIDGLVNQPQVVVENELGQFRLAWFAAVAAGMWLDVDPVRRSALLQGQASRPPNVRRWPKLAAGLNTIRFRAADYSASALLTAMIRPTL